MSRSVLLRRIPWLGRLARRVRMGHADGPRGEQGQVVVLVACGYLFLFILGLVAVNGAIAVSSRTSAQRAADAGALAGCLDLPGTRPGQNPAGIAQQYVEASTRNNTGGATSTHIEGRSLAQPAPAVSTSGTVGGGGGALANDQITVNVRRTQRMFGIANVTISANATCRRAEGGMPVLHSLSTGRDSFSLEQATLNLPRGGIVVGAANCAGGDFRTMTVAGGGVINARWIDLCTGQQPFLSNSSSIFPNAAPGWLADPFGGVNEPQLGQDGLPPVPQPNTPQDMPSCDYGNAIHTTMRNPVVCTVAAGSALTGGVYWGGIYLDGNGSSTPITLSAGIYYLAGGGLRVSPGTVVEGSGVLFFNARNPGAQNPPRRVCGAITFDDQVQFRVTPPISGEWEGLVIFQARPNSGLPNCSASTRIQSGVTMGLPDPPYGSIYLPGSTILIGPQSVGPAGPTSNIIMRIVAYEIDITGPVEFRDVFIPSGDVNHGDIRLSE